MHRSTPIQASFRGYTSGGARTIIDKADDSKLMQEMGGNFMKGETRQKVESPQNYGFTSVVMDADKGQDGQISGSAEGFISFMGGNRSFPVCTVMDDRRHRLKGLDKGDTAMYRTKDDKQQFHLTTDGGFWSAPQDKTARMQLVVKSQQQGQQQSGQQQGQQSGQGGQQKPTGQNSVYKGGRSSDFFFHLTQDGAMASGKNVYLRQGTSFGSDSSSSSSGGGSPATHNGGDDAPPDQTDNVKVHVADDSNVYLGGKKGDGTFLRVMLEGEQIAQNVYALSGGGSEPPDSGGGGGTVHSANAPLGLDSTGGTMSLAQAAPLTTNGLGQLALQIAAPLFIDGSGNLSSLPGPTGASGATGPVGPAGPQGATGFVGPPGASGPAGPSGPAGASGATGPVGPAGASGATGPGYTATSATSFLIGTGSKAFTTQAGLAYSVGARVRASSNATPTNFMEGLVTAYSGTTLTVNVDLTGGSGTAADWNINLAGQQGATGSVGPAGASGATGPTGGVGAAGASGATGPVGPAGASGATGPVGPSGSAGASGATGPAGPAVAFNCGRFIANSATQVVFLPYNGDLVKIAGTIYNIPSGGVVSNNTGAFVNQVAGQSLAANTLYYVYVFNNAGTLALNFSTTGHGMSGTSGNVGVETMTGTGGVNYTLVGMVWTTASGQFADNGQYRGVISWFNRRDRPIGVSFSNASASGVNGSYSSLNGGVSVIACNWVDECFNFGLDCQCGATAGITGSIAVAYDSTTGNIMQNMYVYGNGTIIFPVCVWASYPTSEGAHSYFVIGTGSVTASAGTLQMNNATLWGFTRG